MKETFEDFMREQHAIVYEGPEKGRRAAFDEWLEDEMTPADIFHLAEIWAKKQIEYEQVRQWIVANSDDREKMDAINKLTYVFTTKYAEQQSRG